MAESVELLFFDTFAHDNTEELNLDLVQFPKPVFVTEVRIIPLGARVQADFPGGVRLGATNPSQFSIEFFVNDLGKTGASTFESLGGFDYNQNGCINMECILNDTLRKIPTDGLVLRGWYTTITLAVYGILTANITEQLMQPVVPPIMPPQTNQVVAEVPQIVPNATMEGEWPQDVLQPVPMEYSQPAVTAYPQTYGPSEQFNQQDYSEYYEVPKDPRNYHHTPEQDWDNKSRGRSLDRERERGDRDRERDRGRDIERDRYGKNESHDRDSSRTDSDRRDRDNRHFSRSRSSDRTTRDYRESSRERDRDRDWDHDRSLNIDYRDRDRSDKDWERDRDRDRDRDRSYKHSESYRNRNYAREDREESRKRPRTPPPIVNSPKRPHTPQNESRESESVKVDESREDKPEVKDSTDGAMKSPKMIKSPQKEETVQIEEEFEPILSDEDILDDSEHFQEVDYDYSSYTNNDDLIKLFVPGTTELKKYEKTKSFIIQENSVEVEENLKVTIGIMDDFFKSSITKYTLKEFENMNSEIKEEFIHLGEKIIPTMGSVDHFICIVQMYVELSEKKHNYDNVSDKEIISQVETIVHTLMDWLEIALNFSMANVQNQPAYKIRHIKCGVRLSEWCSNSENFIHLLCKRNFFISDILLSLYHEEFMALSIKLMILRALDSYLLHKSTIDQFITSKPIENGLENRSFFQSKSGYKNLVQMVQNNPSVRIKFALTSILRKLNLFEVLYKLRGIISKMKSNPEDKNDPEDLDFVTKALNQILNFCQLSPFVLSQPKRFLPVASQFEINRSEVRNVVVNFLKMHDFLEGVVLLLTLPNTMNSNSIKTPICKLLSKLLQFPEGLEYLSSNCTTTNLLLQCLLSNEEEIQFQLPDTMVSRCHYLGLKLAYKIQTLYHVEYLLDVAGKHKYDCDVNEIIDNLHALFCLTFSSVGKFSCPKVLGMGDNFKCLLQFLDSIFVKDKSEVHLNKLKKSPGIGYVIDLIAMTIMYVPNIPLLEKYSKQLLQIVSQQDYFDSGTSAKVNEFAPFVKPFENLTCLKYDNISNFFEIITKNIDTVTNSPGQLISCLNIIYHLGISKHDKKSEICSDNPLNNFAELKYKHVILQLFFLDGVAMLTKILQKICDYYEQPYLHTSTFVSNQSINIVNTIAPAVELLKQMLSYVIQCRNTNFKDLTSVPVLLQTYNLLQSFPSTSPTYTKARKICETIVETLLVYTQPVSEEVNEKDSLNKTLWTMMCGEVIKFTLAAPYTFISGLLVFSELLPLPFPIQTKKPLKSEEISWLINLRKLWSAHLHPHSNNIQDIISKMCTSLHQPLLNLLRRVCVQLSDLAANSAIMIARGILDSIYSELGPLDEKSEVCNSYAARMLNFLACLVTHGTIKCAVLQLINPNNPNIMKGDEKYLQIPQIFSRVLKLSEMSTSHVQAQECILSIIQSFCDTEITLLQYSNEEKLPAVSDVYLSNCLPTRENLLLFISTLVEHLMSDNSFVTFLPIVRTFLLLTEHDYGFFHVRDFLRKKNQVFFNALDKLARNFSKDNGECLSTLNTLVEFLRVCSTLEEDEEENLAFKPRTTKMSIEEIKLFVGWKDAVDESSERHPLYKLEDLLKELTQEDKTFDSLLESVSGMISLLNTDTTNMTKETTQEPTLPQPESLLVQFSQRPVFTLTDIADDRLTSVYWLSVPSEEGDTDVENVSIDLTDFCKQNLSQDVNLIREVEKLCRICSSSNIEVEGSKPKGNEEQEKMKKPFVSPAARRGFPRTVQARSDLFRSRPPNTSRPPSLHVDDFVALETCGAQPTGPTGYNKISRELLSTTRVARGSRGRAFVTSERAVHYRQMAWWGASLRRNPY